MENGSAFGLAAIGSLEKIACESELKNLSFELTSLLTVDSSNHLRTHLKPVYCSWPGCNFRDSCQKDMRRHYKTHRSRKTVQCRFCDKWFTRKCNLGRHEREMHGGKKRVRK